MVRYSLRFARFLGLMMYIISSATSSSPSATIFILEEKLHTLTDNFVMQFYLYIITSSLTWLMLLFLIVPKIKFKEVVENKQVQLEAKNAKLEANDQIHVSLSCIKLRNLHLYPTICMVSLASI